jgi:ComEC/Rec2-related protein
MKRPLVPVASWFAAGIVLGWWAPGPYLVLFPACAVAVLGALWVSDARRTFLAAALLLLGWTDQTIHEAILSPADLRQLVGDAPGLAVLRGRLLATPEVRLSEDPAGEAPARVRSQSTLRVREIQRGSSCQPAAGCVLVTLPGRAAPEIYGGREVEVFGVLRPPPTAAAPGLFDYRAYLAKEGIYFQLQTSGVSDWRVLDAEAPPGRPLSDRFIDWATKVLERDLPASGTPGPVGLGDQPLDLLRAMTLGWKAPLTETISLPFQRTGTMHIFAISGLHIALVVEILVNLLRAVRVPRGGCGVVVIPAIWFYTAATGWQASAVRSTVMMTIVLLGWSLHRPQDLLNSLAGAAWVLLAWQPSQLFQTGFQLSFAVVLSLALFQPRIEAWRDRLFRRDPLAAPGLRSRWQERRDAAVRWITSSLAASLAAWLGSVALIAGTFHLLTPVGLMANLVVVPLSGLALMCNLGALCCGDWLPFLGGLFNHSGWFWMKTIVVFSEQAAALPGAWWHVRSPGLLECVVFHTLLVWLLIRRTLSRAAGLALGGACGLGALACVAQALWPGGTARITVLPAGNGAAVFCEAARGRALLVDCGSAMAAKFVVSPFLRSRGVNTLDELALTHGDQRHVEGTARLLQEFRVEGCSMPPQPSRSAAFRQARASLEAARLQPRPLCRGERVADWTVLHPAAGDRFPQGDDNAVVLERQLGGLHVLLLSDLGMKGQGKLMEREPGLLADVVVVGMPAQGEALMDAWLEVLRPQVVVLCAGEFPANEQPSRAFLARLMRRGIEVFSTWTDGAVSLKFSPGECRLSTMSGRECSLRPRAPSGDPSPAGPGQRG